MSAKKIIVKCDSCSKEFEKYICKIGKHNFCCRDCYLKFHSKDVPICICEICGKTFKGSKQNANRFCSKECYNEFHNIKDKERECPGCGKKFIARNSTNKYCSQECHLKILHLSIQGENHPNQKGGITSENDKMRKSKEYKEQQQQVFKKDFYCCKICKSKEDINAHHLFGQKEYPDKRFDVDNGVTLCKKCHILVHKKYGYETDEKMTPDFLKEE